MITPNESWTVAQIKTWLDEREIEYVPSDNKATLLSKVGVENV